MHHSTKTDEANTGFVPLLLGFLCILHVCVFRVHMFLQINMVLLYDCIYDFLSSISTEQGTAHLISLSVENYT